ncbi:MAG: hypothetical protein N2C14_06290, partial [Planctomycetales bacterium]
MLETIDLSVRLDKADYENRKREIQTELHRAQRRANEENLGIIVIFEGWDLSGKSRCIQFLTERMDPRGFKVHAMYPPSKQERQYPFARRYLLRAPARGRIAIFLRSWYYHVLDERIQTGDSAFNAVAALDGIRRTEQTLADEGYLIIKFWLHIDQAEQKRRRKKHSQGKYRRPTGPDDPKQHKKYREYAEAAEQMLAMTSVDYARWYLIPANDPRHARAAVATHFSNAVHEEIQFGKESRKSPPPDSEAVVTPLPPVGDRSLLSRVDLSQDVDEDDYQKRLKQAQLKLCELQFQCVEKDRGAIMIFQGWDAAGK